MLFERRWKNHQSAVSNFSTNFQFTLALRSKNNIKCNPIIFYASQRNLRELTSTVPNITALYYAISGKTAFPSYIHPTPQPER